MIDEDAGFYQCRQSCGIFGALIARSDRSERSIGEPAERKISVAMTIEKNARVVDHAKADSGGKRDRHSWMR